MNKKLLLSASAILLLALLTFSITFENNSNLITGNVVSDQEYLDSNTDSEDTKAMVDCDLECPKKCSGYDYAKCFDNECYCLNVAIETCDINSCNDYCPFKASCSLNGECLCSGGEVEKFSCQNYLKEDGEKGIIIYSNVTNDIVIKKEIICNDNYLNDYSCRINNYFIDPNSPSKYEQIDPEYLLETLMIKSTNENCNFASCGASKRGICSKNECICISDIETEFVQELVINYLMFRTLNIDANDMNLVLKAHFKYNELSEDEISNLERSLREIKKKLASPNKPPINYRLLY